MWYHRSRQVFCWGYSKTHLAGIGRSCQDGAGATDQAHHSITPGRHSFARQDFRFNTSLGEPVLTSQTKRHLPEQGLPIITYQEIFQWDGDVLLQVQGGALSFRQHTHTYRRYRTQNYPILLFKPSGCEAAPSQSLQDGQKSSSSWQLQLQQKVK